MTQQENPQFSIEKIYVKDLSLEVPNAPAIFMEQENPEISMRLQTAGKQVADDVYEATLTITVSAQIGEKNLYLIEILQSGIFRLNNIPADHIEPILLIACPNILFPFAREAVADLCSRGGFAPVMMQPVNFESMYAARQQQNQAETESAPETELTEA